MWNHGDGWCNGWVLHCRASIPWNSYYWKENTSYRHDQYRGYLRACKESESLHGLDQKEGPVLGSDIRPKVDYYNDIDSQDRVPCCHGGHTQGHNYHIAGPWYHIAGPWYHNEGHNCHTGGPSDHDRHTLAGQGIMA